MRFRRHQTKFVCGMALSLFCVSLLCSAQRARRAEQADGEARNAPRVRITDVRFDYKKSPLFQDVSVAGARREYEWMQIFVEYETDGGEEGLDGDEWVNELTLDWYVAFTRGRRQKPLLMTTTVTYVDVVEGEHHAVVYVRPRFIRRYTGERRVNTSSIGVHVEAKIGVAAADFNYARGRFPDEWWKSKGVEQKPGELLTRLETPFAPLDYDYYEDIKRPPR